MTTTTQPDPIRAEALGQDTVTAAFAGRQWRVPLDVDTWPLQHIRQCLGVGPDGRILVNHGAVVLALEALLADQFQSFLEAAPLRGQLVPASHALAEAVGVGRAHDALSDRYDKAFGAILRTLTVIETWPTAVESDLNRFWGLDYRDRFRFDKHGRRKLTFRQIHARICHLPADSALAVEMNRRSPMELLLMDLYEPLAGRPHPARPLTPEQAAERHAEAEKARKARADYEARRGRGGIDAALQNARANALRGKA